MTLSPNNRDGLAAFRWPLFIWILLLLSQVPQLHAQNKVFITEFVANNSGTLLDQDGDKSDWIEIYNTGPDAVNLGGWHLTDHSDNLTLWTFPATNLAAGKFLVVFASRKDRATAGQQLHTSFQLASSGEFLAMVRPDGVTIEQAFAPLFPPQVSGVSYGLEVSVTTNSFVAPEAAVRWWVPQNSGEFPADWAGTNFDDSAWSVGLPGIGFDSSGALSSVILTDINSVMTNVNASALIRAPFTIPEEELPVLDQLTLRMKYDDGFIAYLNGVEIARRNAPATPVWDSPATNDHLDASALQFEDIDVTPFIPLLQEGGNVLAIQGFNLSAADTNFLVLPELLGRTASPGPERYYSQPTPGATNSGPALGLVANTKFSVNRGFFDTPFTVAITCTTSGAEIRYTTNGSTPSAVSGILYTAPITINRTTALRAIATKPGWMPSDVDTHTYVFLNNVITQSTASATGLGFPSTWAGYSTDYAMDPNVTGPHAAQVTNALRALPSVFITTSISNLFHYASGIYSHPLSSGVAWERPVSIEMVGTNGATEFQENAGLRIQGGVFFRDFSMTQKKSFRVLFKSAYGAGKLQHDLFKEPGAAEEFDGFVLRAGANDGYSWGEAGTTVQFTRDEFGRRLILDMGQPAPRGQFVHLYLNGLYWGMYNLVERPNEDFSASYQGGEPEEWDACTAGDYKSGGTAAATRWNNFVTKANWVTTYAGYQALQGNNADGTRNPALPPYFDKVNYADYMIANIWGGNWDWPNKNFWFGYNTNANSTGYKFYMWDFENTMGNSRDRSPLYMTSPRSEVAAQWVGLPHYYLKDYAEYQVDFADRVQRYFFNNGLLTPQVLTNRYLQIANTVQSAIVAESARWGDDNHTPAYGENEWLAERDWILNSYLPQRSAIVLNQFRSSMLFPTLSAPTFSQWGGAVDTGFNLVITHANGIGTITYTLNGNDPRQAGTGAVGAGALTYAGPVAITQPTLVRARVRNGSQWSAIVEAMFYPPQDLSRLALTEIMYHAPDVGLTNGSEFDFLELKNTGTNTLNLWGLKFTAGVTFTFTNGTTLAPGAFCVLVRNAAAFAAKYPGVAMRGVFSGNLDNGGETLTLSHPLGTTVFSVNYDDEAPWPIMPDGFGYSLVQKNPAISQAPDRGESWRASSAAGGSPGADDPTPNLAPIVINEILTHTDLPLYDSIELFNPTATNVNLGGWYLTDTATAPRKFRIQDGTTIGPNSYAVFTDTQFNTGPNAFRLSEMGEWVFLFSSDATTNLTGYDHGYEYGAAPNGVSFGRYFNSQSNVFFTLQSAITLGTNNAGPRVGPIVISEIMYRAPEFNGGDDDLDEFIELQNIAATSVPLYDPAAPTNTWRLRNAVDFDFPPNQTLAAGTRLLVVGFNPTNTIQLAAFRARYGVSNSIAIYGPWSGKLDNSGEAIELKQPGLADDTLVTPFYLIDKVAYSDAAPWPVGADGIGNSLQRFSLSGFGNDPTNWFAAGTSVGRGSVLNAPPTVALLTPTNHAVFAYGLNPALTVAVSDADGTIASVRFLEGSTTIGFMTNAPFNFTWVAPPSGEHVIRAIAVDDLGGAAVSAPVNFTVAAPPVMSLASQYVFAAEGNSGTTNLLFTVTVTPPPVLTVSAQFATANITALAGSDYLATNGVLTFLPGETNKTLVVRVIGDVVLEPDEYFGFTLSNPANCVLGTAMAYGIISNDDWSSVDFFTEVFDTTTNDLSFRSFTFTPDGSTNFYSVCQQAITAFPSTPTGGTIVSLTDDSSVQVTLDATERVSLYGKSTNVFFIGSNGYLTFGAGDSSLGGDLSSHFQRQRISGVFRDLNPATGGSISWKRFTNCIAVTYAAIPDFGNATRTNNFQIEMFFDGRIRLNFLGIKTQDGLVGLSAGQGQPAGLRESDFSAYGICPQSPAIQTQPQSRTVPVETNVTLTVTASGYPAPGYQWFFNSNALAGAAQPSLTISNVDLVHAGNYYVVVSNSVGVATSRVATLTVFLPDTDGDGLPDRWEKANGTDPAVADASADPDGDRMSNQQEYLAGTSPTNAASVLKLEAAPLTGSDFVFSFTAISNHSYTIQAQTTLNGEWRKVRDVVAVATNRTAWQTNRINGDNRFFRVVTPLIGPADSEGDTLPDDWELTNGTNPFVDDCNADPDHDQATNFQEYLAGTSPTNAASVLKIESWTLASGKFVLSFTARSNRTYTVQSRLTPGNGTWQECQNVSAATNDRTVWLTNNVATNSSQFFRLMIPALP